jgi:hypothetical protein
MGAAEDAQSTQGAQEGKELIMMNIEQAEMLHVKLRQELPGDGDARSALDAVVQLHAPSSDGWDCKGCGPWSDITRQRGWPCETIATINAYAHVEGLPTS